MTANLILPHWRVIPNDGIPLSDEVWLAWLTEERKRLLATGQLDKLRADVARHPVNIRFRWPEKRNQSEEPRD